MNTQLIERLLKQLRAAELCKAQAAGAAPTSTEREYVLMSAEAIMRSMAAELDGLAQTAQNEANDLETQAAAAAAERKVLKKQQGA